MSLYSLISDLEDARGAVSDIEREIEDRSINQIREDLDEIYWTLNGLMDDAEEIRKEIEEACEEYAGEGPSGYISGIIDKIKNQL